MISTKLKKLIKMCEKKNNMSMHYNYKLLGIQVDLSSTYITVSLKIIYRAILR